MIGFRIKVGKGKIVDGKFKPAPSYRDASHKLRAKNSKKVKVKRK
jgi:hypothetical protein